MGKIKASDLELHEVIGRGGFGDVNRATWRTREGQNCEVAVKTLRSGDENELEMLTQLQHPHIIRLLGFVKESSPEVKGAVDFMLVLEFGSGGSLRSYLDEHASQYPISSQLLFDWMKQVTLPIKYLKEKDIQHRDIKSPNYIITDGMVVKLGDFGTAKEVTKTRTTGYVGTRRWAAPEYIRDSKLSTRNDIHPLGLVIWEIMTSELPYHRYTDEMDYQLMQAICEKKERPAIPAFCPTELANMLKQCWEEDRTKRPTLDQILDVIESTRRSVMEPCKTTVTVSTQTTHDSEPTTKEQTRCYICKNEVSDPRALDCLHSFCLVCLREWTVSSTQPTTPCTEVTCPVCREVTATPKNGVDGLTDYISLLGEKLSGAYITWWQQGKETTILPETKPVSLIEVIKQCANVSQMAQPGLNDIIKDIAQTRPTSSNSISEICDSAQTNLQNLKEIDKLAPKKEGSCLVLNQHSIEEADGHGSHVLKEIRVLEIQEDSIKLKQGQLIGKLTGDVSGTVDAHIDGATTSVLLDRPSEREVDDIFGRSREKERRYLRRTKSLDTGNRKTKDKDTYDLHLDIRVKERDKSEDQKCTVCFSRRDLTQRKDCEHMTCRSCKRIGKRIGLNKGQCSLCKLKSKGQKAASSMQSSDMDQRSRSRVKQVAPDTTPWSTHENEQYRPAGQPRLEEVENQHPDVIARLPEKGQRSEDGQNDTGQSSVPLKFRLKSDKLMYKTAEGLKVRVYQGDLTKEKIGAIVNAANESLIHAGGVAGAIARAAGTMMTVDCTRYIAKHGLLYPAQVMWTSPGDLPCQFVIHAVGPRWGEYNNKAECYETFKTTYLRCLEVAEKNLMVAAVAMPIISSGIFGVPITQCIDALYEAVAEFSKSWNPATHTLKEIRVLEIQKDSIKVIQGQLIGKLTDDGSGAVGRHIDTGSHGNHDDDAQIDGATRGHLVGITDDIGRGGASHYPADQYRTGATCLDDHGFGATSLSHRRALGQEHLGASGLEHHGAGIEHRGATTTGLLDRPNEREVDYIYTNNSRQSHEGTLYPNLQELMQQGVTDGQLSSATNEGTRFEEIHRFRTDSSGKQKYSSLPNLRDHSDGDEVLPGSARTTTGGASTLSKARPLSPGFDIDAGSRTSATLPASSGRSGNSARRRRDSDFSTARTGTSYLGADGGAAAMGATGGVGETDNESMIESILIQHENGRQTAEQIDETQKLLNLLLAKYQAPSSGRSREKERGSSRRTRSLDRGNRKTKDKDYPIDTYDLQSDIRLKERDKSEDHKCTVCFSRRDLTQRKDCEHMTCRSCKRIGLNKGQCSLCKLKSKGQKAASSMQSSDMDQRSRSRVKKVAPDTTPLWSTHGNEQYRPTGQPRLEEVENQHPDVIARLPEKGQRSDDCQVDIGQSSVPLKFRLKSDKLMYKTAEGLKVRVYQGDITKEKIGAIVNAANESLIHAGGVAGVIARVAGTMMSVDCTRYIAKHGLLYPAQVMWTSPGNLPCQFVIHAVGPRWGEYNNKAECYETLKTTYLRCLEVAEKNLMVAAVAMPIISSGIFGVPISQCVDALYDAVAEFSKSWNPATHTLKEIRVLEIQKDSIKVIHAHLVGKLTCDGRGTLLRHIGSHGHHDGAHVDLHSDMM